VPSRPTSATPIADPGVDRSIDAARLRAGFAHCGTVIARHAAGLTRLDAVLGDGDHGDNLVIGFRAVDDLLADLPAETTPGDILRAVGHRLVAAVGGASGPLYGTACIEAGFVAGGAPVLDGPTVAAMLRAEDERSSSVKVLLNALASAEGIGDWDAVQDNANELLGWIEDGSRENERRVTEEAT
jgi:hypothetical protein